jgi:Ferritin-like
MKIQDLMRVPREHHTVAWLKASLQTAIELELSTLPPYLTAMWSIVSANGPVYDLIYSIVFEEMLHFGLACNLLTTIGGTPRIASLETVPKYPGPLPGGVHPGLVVPLVGLTRRLVLEVFMEIEYPESRPITKHAKVNDPTIGAFYTAIGEAFKKVPHAIQGTNQLTDPTNTLELFAINNLRDAERAISTIKEQGEGTGTSPLAAKHEFAHYYKFGEIYYGHKLVRKNRDWDYTGRRVPFPKVYPVAQVPAEGYPKSKDARAFDKQYTQLLHLLQKAWAAGDAQSLGDAIYAMPPLRDAALTLMTTPLDAGGYNYGPAFRFVC